MIPSVVCRYIVQTIWERLEGFLMADNCRALRPIIDPLIGYGHRSGHFKDL